MRKVAVLFVLSSLLTIVVLPATTGMAQDEAPATPAGEVIMTSPYPSLAAQPGDTAEFTVTIRSGGRHVVDLSLDGLPEGWTGQIQGAGNEVDAATTDPDTPPVLNVNIDVPDDAEEGATTIDLVGDIRDGGEVTLPLQVRISEQAGGTVELTTDFSTLQGASDQTFQFDLTLANNTPAETSFSLAATGPEGWIVTATPTSEDQATTATVAAGETTTVRVTADPLDVEATGTYEVIARVTGAGQTVELPLTVELTGNPDIAFTTTDERLNAEVTIGDSTTVPLLLSNIGTSDLTNVTFTGTPPEGWEVTFEPETVAAVAPGDFIEITATVTPGEDSVAGDYLVSMQATGEGTDAVSVDVRTTVNRSSAAGIVGVALIGAALIGLTMLFRRMGRR